MTRFLGLALFVVGIVLLGFGLSASDSIGSEFSRFFAGKPTDKSIWLLLGGIVSMILGIGGMVSNRGTARV
ncbi:MAG TPA: DUF3185 family protein [Planctomycetota bacterium]|nr:DUF3185 family protein [Planctomycetota bacterium]